MPSSHALLLRLFLSPSFFSVHVALRYLLLYSDNIGITYYLTRRMKELDIAELRDIWGFICHLLISRPSKSRALEVMVVDIAQRSTHFAMLTLWFMQAALQDLSQTRKQSQSFIICQRVLHECHTILFDGVPQPVSSAPYTALSIPSTLRPPRRKIKHHVAPAFVGIGLTIAGVGSPQLTNVSGYVAIEQGRAEEDSEVCRHFQVDEDDFVQGTGIRFSSDSATALDETDEVDSPTPDEDLPPHASNSEDCRVDEAQSEPSLNQRIARAAQTVPLLPLHLQHIRRSRASQDPLGQRDAEENEPSKSSPSFPSVRSTPRSPVTESPEAALGRYSAETQSLMLRSHYTLSEIQFLLTLENISNRLLVVPKLARVSALRAELTALNHKLPAEVCVPLWCSSFDFPRENTDIPEPHHRIVRIPPGESVVLNSAERAPYLLIVEILNEGLDFDPSRRANWDVLKKIVSKEVERERASNHLISFTKSSHVAQPLNSTLRDSDVGNTNDRAGSPFSPTTSSPTAVSLATAMPVGDEEIDLVEQLYGAEKSLRSRPIDLSDSIVFPRLPKNRELDLAAWSRSVSSPSLSSPTVESGGTPAMLQLANGFPRFESSLPSTPHDSEGSELGRNHLMLSLDEYSDRMRTAAVMLAQLNANVVREPITHIETPQGGSRLGNAIARERAQTRMKLQQSEAAAIRDRIMKEMMLLEEERMERMRDDPEGENVLRISDTSGGAKSAEDEDIIRRELNRVDPSAMVFSESWTAKKSRIRHASPYGHLASWDCVSIIVKTGGDLRQEQLAVQLIRLFQSIWAEEKCSCWVRYFRILITGASSGLVETITDALSIHSIKKAEYAKRFADGRLGHVTLLDHFKSAYGDPDTAKFIRAQRNFVKSLAGYSLVTYILQVKDRHNGNILLDQDGHLIHIDFGFILSNTPGNIGFEAAPFKLPAEYVEVLGGVEGKPFLEFRRMFREGFEAARKHCDSIITLVELMQKDSALPCFSVAGEQTSAQLRDRLQPMLTHSLMIEYVDRLIDSSLGSHWTRLYDSYQYYSQSIL